MDRITLAHGAGGAETARLIEGIFSKHFLLGELEDAAYLDVAGPIAITTDSFVVSPIFFPGGDIGKLAVCGTLNDLAVSGAEPVAVTCAFILEEGLPLEELETVVVSMAREASSAGVRVVAGDTKVVPAGRGDKVFINTTGVGVVRRRFSAADVKDGDLLVVTGTIGEHGLSVLLARGGMDVESEVKSDCANLFPLLERLFSIPGVRWMRDATRGGLATVCLELCGLTGLGVDLFEDKIPVREDVAFLCEMLGLDPLFLANEGRALVVVSGDFCDEVLDVLREHPLGVNASVVGRVTDRHTEVVLKTELGGERFLDYSDGEPLPRIC